MKRRVSDFTENLIWFSTCVLLAGCLPVKQISPTRTEVPPPIPTAPSPSLELPPTGLPTKSESITEEEFRERWLVHPPCLPPCWEGITPGKTTATEAITILETNPLFTNVFSRESPIANDKTGAVLWDFSINGEVFRGEARFSTETENHIIYMINPWTPFVALGELTAAYGVPSHIIASVTRPIHPEDVEGWAVDIVWLSKGITFLRAGTAPFPAIDEKFTAKGLQYFTPGLEGYAKLVNSDLLEQMKPWQGNGPFEMYYTPGTGP